MGWEDGTTEGRLEGERLGIEDLDGTTVGPDEG